ncbi:hypothetical protein [Nocardioides plantarum]|uniref:DUF5666 domain-containing protein n=1 Tax=Nocardioides plantarum TaxID=29299 RepID=A0ABV5KA23_9ACTN|nr:hypothetical protein [Nocardioides plantarum]
MPARVVLALLLLLGAAGCSTAQGDRTSDRTSERTSGNMVVGAPATAPERPHWVTGRLVVEPVTAGRACLLLRTTSGTYVLRSASRRLVPVAWQSEGTFDATRSGIARGRRLVAAYSDESTSVRGAVSSATDPVCPTYPTLSFVAAARPRQEPSAPTATPVAPVTPVVPATDPADGPVLPGVTDPELVPVRMSGRITVVRGNQGEGWCLALETDAGAYTLSEDTRDYDAVLTTVDGRIDERRTGLHHHGRSSLGMAASYGQRVALRGTLSSDTDVQCSRYHDLRVTGLG